MDREKNCIASAILGVVASGLNSWAQILQNKEVLSCKPGTHFD